MKFKTILSAGVFAAMAALSMGAQAASDTDKAAASMQADKKMKPHSHMQEKTGISPPASPVAAVEEKSGKAKAKQDKDKHYHPRDGKS